MSTGYWAMIAVGRILWAAISAWREQHPWLPAQLPLVTLGPSSGGWFAGQAARHWSGVVAVSMTVAAMPLSDLLPPPPHRVTSIMRTSSI